MTQQIQLQIVDDKVKVITPYNADFVQKCRNLRGTFKNGAWWFDDSIIDYVREAMIQFYGTTGETSYETCSLLISDYTQYGQRTPCILFGRTIAKAFGRDSGARLGEDIVLLEGEVRSGGSVKNWETCISDATFLINNFPIPSLELPEVKAAIEEGWCEVKPNKKKRPAAEIEAEITELEKRIESLNAELLS
ncbi:MAG: hypothetical protein JW783_08455 [Bacteroidales bacterium]|nr:hypothetical protein [Bacteroidales bacterium]MBN2749973.1 hypothetical protein [Bacteroidales bacterium]